MKNYDFFFQNQKNLFGLVCGWDVFCFVFRISVKKLENKSGFGPQYKKKICNTNILEINYCTHRNESAGITS